MKRTCDTLAPCLLAALSLALQGGGTVLQAGCDNSQSGKTQQNSWECIGTDRATAYNRAGSLIGMKVDNEHGQYLGRVKDIVIDCSSDHVSYVALAVNTGFLGLGQKLVAVPFDAFRPSDKGTYLVLNADRKSLQMAQGFPIDQWPSATSPSWGAAPPWKEGSDSSQAATTESKSEKSETTMPSKSENRTPDVYPPGSLGFPGY